MVQDFYDPNPRVSCGHFRLQNSKYQLGVASDVVVSYWGERLL